MADFGVFEDHTEYIDGPYYSRESAEAQAETYRANPDSEDYEYEVREICPDHEHSPKDDCEECFPGE